MVHLRRRRRGRDRIHGRGRPVPTATSNPLSPSLAGLLPAAAAVALVCLSTDEPFELLLLQLRRREWREG